MNKTDLARLKDETNILDLAQQLGLQVKGRQARCFNTQAHKNGDKKPSLGLDVKTNRYKCFTCGVSGSVIDLYMEVKKVDFTTALNELNNGRFNLQDNLAKPSISEGEKLLDFATRLRQNETVLSNSNLSNYTLIYKAFIDLCPLDNETLNYLTGDQRGLTKETIKRFNLASVGNYAEVNEKLKKSFSLEDLQLSGLYGEKGNLLFYKHKVITPFYEDGEITFLQGRSLDGTHPKYLNLAGIPKPIFNIDILKALKEGNSVYVCEGVFDAMMLTQEGYNAVAILGVTDFKPTEVSLFSLFNTILALDNDEAGIDMTQKIGTMFLLGGQAIKSKKLPEGTKDITEYFLHYAKQTV